MEPTKLLIDGAPGIHAVDALLAAYSDRLEWDKKFYGRDADGLLDALEHTGEVVINNGTGQLWTVEWNEGDIIAVHPHAEWCDQCECYHNAMPDNVTEYKVAQSLMPYIINGDDSGIELDEVAQVDQFLELEAAGMSNYHWTCSAYEHESETVVCDITGLLAECVELFLVNMGEVK